MPTDHTDYDFFVSYAREDNTTGWITRFVEELLAEHRKFSGGRELNPFFDQHAITTGADWELYLAHGIANSRLFLAFISPNYFASDWCRKEWRAWIDTEISKHILTEGVRPVYLVEVPGFTGKGALGEQAVAQKVAELCHLPVPHDRFLASAAPVVKQVRRRQLLSDFVKPFADEGVDALRRDDLHRVLEILARDLDHHAQLVAAAASSETTVPPYNKKFSGRLDELLELRKRLKDDQAGVVCGVQGLGGIGKTELAFTYAHAFASAYPGGRFLVPCEGRSSLREAVLCLGDFHEIRTRISDEERKQPATHFAAVARCLSERLARLGHVLLVLDNVTDPGVVSPEQTDCLTTLGPRLHLLATTRRLPPAGGNWLILGELPPADALTLLEKHRSFDTEADGAAAGHIVKRLGGFALAVELVAAWLAAHPGSSYPQFAARLGLEDLENMAGDQEVKLRRHNHERRLTAVLGPVLADLKPAERRTVEYAALLPPDHVALPWLRELVSRDFPDACQPTRLVADPWQDLWQRLVRLAMFSRPEDETTEPRLLRVHRLVQDLVRRELAGADRTARQQAVDALVKERDAALEKTTRWEDARWELEPLEALAWLWAEAVAVEVSPPHSSGPEVSADSRRRLHPLAAWLLNQVGVHFHSLAEWSRCEAVWRRALQIDEQSYGENHPDV
ncbi:MAG: toll/interleukin-1 receptor domain-containing protein, partial [Verrucomicrobiota bacterium]